MQRNLRQRKMTEKGQEYYESEVYNFYRKLTSIKKKIENCFIQAENAQEQNDFELLRQLKDDIESHLQTHLSISKTFEDYLKRCDTEESSLELSSHLMISNTLTDRVSDALSRFTFVKTECVKADVHVSQNLEEGSVRSCRSRRSRHSRCSSTSSSVILAKSRAKAEAARTRLQFAEEESLLKLKQAECAVDLELLTHKKELAVAEAELSVVQEEICEQTLFDNDVIKVKENVVFPKPNFGNLADHRQTLSETIVPPPHVNNETVTSRNMDRELPFNVNAPEFIPAQQHKMPTQVSDLTSYLLKRDLFNLRLQKFNDNPAEYQVWKTGFVNISNELNLSPSEEIELLVRWLGTESGRYANSIKASNAHDQVMGLRRIWARLDERYGTPEAVEATVKRKLFKFEKITVRDYQKLYDLCDILCEIQYLKENEHFRTVLAYFDSSIGINPILQKLPPFIQGKWTDKASQYKRMNKVSFPPFTYFVKFIQDLTSTLNDPSFKFEGQEKVFSQKDFKFRPPVSVKKTEVEQNENTSPHQPLSQVKDVPYCPIHKAHHTLGKCRTFKALPHDEKKQFLIKHSVCFRCCESDKHYTRDCTRLIKCDECGSNRHCTALHISWPKTPHTPVPHGGEAQVKVANKCSQVCGEGFQGKSCAKTILAKIYPQGSNRNPLHAYVIIDDQSNRTLAKPELFDRLGVTSQTLSYLLSSCNGSTTTYGRQASGLVIESMDGLTTFQLPPVLECEHIPDMRDEIPSPDVVTQHSHLKHLTDLIPPLNKNAPILLLIGRDLPEAHHVLKQCTGPWGSPFAQHLPLGWVVIGDVCLGKTHSTQTVTVNKTAVLTNSRPTCLKSCQNNFKVEKEIMEDDNFIQDTIGDTVFQKTKDDNKVGQSTEDRMFLKVMNGEMKKGDNGNWTAPLPFKSERARLPNNRSQAVKRAFLLDRNLKKNPQKLNDFVDFMGDILDKGHAEKAPAVQSDEECWYLPLFGVYHPKKPSQLRGVFDSSAIFNGVSLNNVLMTGPDFTNSLLGVLLRFREDKVAVTADIQKMFYSFFVNENHRNFLRFFWYEDNKPDAEIIEYRMCVHVFGNSPSPAVATYGLRKTVSSNVVQCDDDVKNFVENNFYVDDALVSVETSEQAISLLKRAQDVLQSEGQLRLHKVASNSTEVMKAFPKEDLAKHLKTLDLSKELLPLCHSLGIAWDLNRDVFKFLIQEDQLDKPYTRRGLLSVVNSLFDPLGFLAPFTIQGKILLRELACKGTDWDEILPADRQSEWNRWIHSLKAVEELSVPRAYVPISPSESDNRQVHIYCDASEKAIASVAYLMVTKDGQTHVGFLLGKAKVAPLHGNTIPRLELCAAVLSTEIAEFISEHLNISTMNMRFYSDSKVVLGYIGNNTRRFFTYVSNRVHKVRQVSSPNQWSYINTSSNPADAATRYVQDVKSLANKWLSGPPTPNLDIPVTVESVYPLVDAEFDKEVKSVVVTAKTEVNKSLDVKRFERFSSWTRLVTAVTALKDLAKRRKGKPVPPQMNSVQKPLISQRFVILELQREVYSPEISCLNNGKSISKQSSICALCPFLDQHGLLRVGGRLSRSDLSSEEKHPLIIPSNSHVAKLLITHFHESVQHQGRHLTEGAVRSGGFWIVGGKRLISTLLHKCVLCRKLRRPVESQKMADLPLDRLTKGAPFSSVGVDTFGPWQIVTRRTRGGSANSKRWAVLFTCLTIRAIHIEVIEDLSSSSFINAVKRFQSIRGKVTLFRSDRGTNFVGATDDLKIDTINVEDGPVKHYLYNSRCQWIFNTPHSSHMGGVWERMIGVVRRILDSLLAQNPCHLTHEVLVTFMAEICAIVNSRPITPVSCDPGCATVLSPSMILTQKSDSIAVPSGEFSLPIMYKHQWARVQQLADIFWERWRREYLQQLQVRRKWTDAKQNLKVDDIVLLKDKSTYRNDWPMGRIVDVYPSDDDIVRKIGVKVLRDNKSTVFTRPVTEVVLLISE